MQSIFMTVADDFILSVMMLIVAVVLSVVVKLAVDVWKE